jgi:FkbM family methyltransferase
MELDPSDMIQSVVLASGSWEPSISVTLEALLSLGDTFVDVGANVGYYTLLASPLVGETGTIYSFEASAAIYKDLNRNIRLNGLDQITAVNVAVGQASGTVRVHLGPTENIGDTRVVPVGAAAPPLAYTPRVEPEAVRMEPLTTLLRDADLSRPMVVKIDVEGFEQAVLEGFEPILQNVVDVAIFLEVSPELWDGANDWLLDFVNRHQFDLYQMFNEYSLYGFFPWTVERPVAVSRLPEEAQYDILLIRGGLLKDRLCGVGAADSAA